MIIQFCVSSSAPAPLLAPLLLLAARVRLLRFLCPAAAPRSPAPWLVLAARERLLKLRLSCCRSADAFAVAALGCAEEARRGSCRVLIAMPPTCPSTPAEARIPGAIAPLLWTAIAW